MRRFFYVRRLGFSLVGRPDECTENPRDDNLLLRCVCGAGVAAAFALPLAAVPPRSWRPLARPLLLPPRARCGGRARPLLRLRARCCGRSPRRVPVPAQACAGRRRPRQRDPLRLVQDRRRAGLSTADPEVGSVQFFSRPGPAHLKDSS